MEHSDIGYLLNHATRQLRLSLGAALNEISLRPQQAAVLMAISRSTESRMTPSAVADSIDMDAATTSGLLERLTRDGWLSCGPNPDDGRSRLFALTDKARQALPKVMKLADAVSTEATRCLTREELETLRQLLRRVCEHNDRDSAKGSVR